MSAYDVAMTAAHRRHRPAVLLAAAALAVGGGLTGCAQIDQLTDRADEARASLQGLEEMSRQTLEQFDWSSLDEYRGTWLGDASEVTEMFRRMPGAEDIQDFHIKGDQGVLEVRYKDEALKADPAVLEQTLREQAEQARQRIRNLEQVEFKVGDETYTF
ncbi:hypothetical protein HMPREF2863_07535 [Micrococcus sp. HMSC067E09]|nr:hypothetical protein HMPREF2863_07535 [Micrococcus sp. HMSC067E09]